MEEKKTEDKKTESKSEEKSGKEIITKDMLIGEVVTKCPESAFIMLQYGLHCVGCHVSAYETIEQGCNGHGMEEETMKKMLDDINKVDDDKEDKVDN